MSNAKNRIQEILADLGLPPGHATYSHGSRASDGYWVSTVSVEIPGRAALLGNGAASRVTQADVAAAEDALEGLLAWTQAEGIDWPTIRAEAQAGDALLKLAGYLSADLSSTEARSRWLQRHESDAALAQVFDRWVEAGDSDLAVFGPLLGEKRKSTLVEAMIWRRYSHRVFTAETLDALGELRAALAPV